MVNITFYLLHKMLMRS